MSHFSILARGRCLSLVFGSGSQMTRAPFWTVVTLTKGRACANFTISSRSGDHIMKIKAQMERIRIWPHLPIRSKVVISNNRNALIFNLVQMSHNLCQIAIPSTYYSSRLSAHLHQRLSVLQAGASLSGRPQGPTRSEACDQRFSIIAFLPESGKRGREVSIDWLIKEIFILR